MFERVALNEEEVSRSEKGTRVFCGEFAGRGFRAAKAHVYTGHAMSCLFCKIIEGTIPSTPVYQDDLVYAFADINPKAPVHLLIVPREHIGSLAEAGKDKEALLGHLLWAAAEIARQKGLTDGYRIVVNTGEDGGQTVDHLHLHLLGGRALTWPPG
jgi:histidine triad (HIT) family protein